MNSGSDQSGAGIFSRGVGVGRRSGSSFGGSGGSVVDKNGGWSRCRRSLTAGSVPDRGSRRPERVVVVSVIEVEVQEVWLDLVRRGKRDGIGRNDVARRLDVGLNTVRVDLGVIRVVHGNNLMSDEVWSGIS